MGHALALLRKAYSLAKAHKIGTDARLDNGRSIWIVISGFSHHGLDHEEVQIEETERGCNLISIKARLALCEINPLFSPISVFGLLYLTLY